METPSTPAGRKLRSRVLPVEGLITQSGQVQALDVRLPDTAQRITGLYAATTTVSGRRYERRDAFVFMIQAATEPTLPLGDTPVRIGPEISRVPGTYRPLGYVLETGLLMVNSLDRYDPEQHTGFYQALTDEVPLQPLIVPPGYTVFYAHTRSLGFPRITDQLGKPLALTKDAVFGEYLTFFSQSTESGSPGHVLQSGLVYESRAYLVRVEQELSSQGNLIGYPNGILFPGDPNRF